MNNFTQQQIKSVPRKVAQGTVKNKALIDALDAHLMRIEWMLIDGDTQAAIQKIQSLRGLLQQ